MGRGLLKVTTTKELAHKKVHVLIYGEGKVGKTSLTLTLPCPMERILYLGVDPGELALRDVGVAALQARNGIWNQEMLQEVYDYTLENRKRYDWQVIDGLDTVGNEVYNHNAEEHKDGRKAWEQTNLFMDQWIRRMRDIDGISSLWITHPTETKPDDMGRTMIRPSMPGNKLKDEIDQYFDIVGYMKQVRAADGTLTPLIQFSRIPDERIKVGDRSGVLQPYEAPNMAAIVEKIKKIGLSTSNYSGSPTVGEVEALKQICKFDKSGKNRKIVEEALGLDKVQSPSDLSRESFNKLMSQL